MGRRIIEIEGKIPSEEEMMKEDEELRAAEPGSGPVRSRPVRGPKIRANLELSSFVNNELNSWVQKLGLPRQSLVTRYILEGMQRDSELYGSDKK